MRCLEEMPKAKDSISTDSLKFWTDSVQKRTLDDLPKVLELCFSCGRNLLMEPWWGERAFQDLKGRFKRPAIYKALLDNRDVANPKKETTLGQGVCPALVARELIAGFSAFPTKREPNWLHELSVLSGAGGEQEIFRGVKVKVRIHGYDVSAGVSSAHGNVLELSERRRRLEYDQGDRTWSLWQQDGHSGGKFLSFEFDADTWYERFLSPRFLQGEEAPVSRFMQETGWTGNDLQEVSSELKDCAKGFEAPAISQGLPLPADRLSAEEWTDRRLLLLAALCIALKNLPGRPAAGEAPSPLSFGSHGYRVVNDIVMLAFDRKLTDGDPAIWRLLMREVVASMWLFSYFAA